MPSGAKKSKSDAVTQKQTVTSFLPRFPPLSESRRDPGAVCSVPASLLPPKITAGRGHPEFGVRPETTAAQPESWHPNGPWPVVAPADWFR